MSDSKRTKTTVVQSTWRQQSSRAREDHSESLLSLQQREATRARAKALAKVTRAGQTEKAA
jgi:hypothetical protein